MKGILRIAAILSAVAAFVPLIAGCSQSRPVRTLGELAEEGGEVLLIENGVETAYLIAAGDHEGVWLLRRDILPETMPFSDYLAYYEDSDVDRFLCGEFLERFPQAYDTWLTPATLPVTDRDALYAAGEGTHTIRRTVFLLSYAETGYPEHPMAAAEGEALEIFSDDNSRIALRDGRPCSWWLRTPYTGFDSVAWSVGGDGVRTELTASFDNGIRPVLCMSPDAPLSSRTGAGKTFYKLDIGGR